MKFKKGDRVEYIGSNSSNFTKGKIYTVREDELNKFGHLTIELDDNRSNTNGHCPEYFKLIEENKMKTSKEMQLKIIDKMRENVENDLALMNSIQYRNRVNSLWDDRVHDVGTSQFERLEMRVKPETITINGVEIPKPLRDSEILEDVVYYHVDNSKFLYNARDGEFIADHGIRFVYETREQAITASKALFGIEG